MKSVRKFWEISDNSRYMRINKNWRNFVNVGRNCVKVEQFEQEYFPHIKHFKKIEIFDPKISKVWWPKLSHLKSFDELIFVQNC